jgi:putative nucleotidyltransferase with HDIG domain
MAILGNLIPKTGPAASIDRVVKRISEVSTLPHIALRVVEVANDPNSGAEDLRKVLEHDAAMSARVLRCVNSSAYALRSKVTNLQQAIALLGMRAVRDLAMTASVSDLFKRDFTVGQYCRAGVWRHLVSVGIGARLLAIRFRNSDPDDMFLAGLLHDIGILLEDQYDHGPFCTVMESLHEGLTLTDVEQQHLGYDHTMLGEKLAEIWRFPDSVKSTIRHHHAATAYRGESLSVVRCVELSNLICSFKGITSVGINLLRFSHPLVQSFGLTQADIVGLGQEIDVEITNNADLFRI